MFAVYLCLVLNAHPHFWLSDDDLEVENKNLDRISQRIADHRRGVETYYTRLAELQANPKADPRHITEHLETIRHRSALITSDLAALDKARALERAHTLPIRGCTLFASGDRYG